MSNGAPPSSSSFPTSPSPASPSPICTVYHAFYCFDVLVAHFEGRDPIDPPFENPNDSQSVPSLSLTITSQSSHPTLVVMLS